MSPPDGGFRELHGGGDHGVVGDQVRGTCYIQRCFIFLYLNIYLSTHLYQVEIHQGEYLDQGRAVTQQYSDYSHNVFDYQFSGSQFSGL